jgi:gluconate kinase
MISAIAGFISAVVEFVVTVVTAIIRWAQKHPRELVIVLVSIALICLSAYGSHIWTKRQEAKVIAALQAEVEKCNKERKDRDEKITRIEKESKTNADKLSTELDESKKNISALAKDYEKKLKEERNKFKVIYVKDKDGKDVEVTLNDKSQVVCERLPDSYRDTVNKMIDEVNKPIRLAPSASLSVR